MPFMPEAAKKRPDDFGDIFLTKAYSGKKFDGEKGKIFDREIC